MTHYIGVDPGASGGIAVLDSSAGVVCVCAIPETEADAFDLLAAYGGGRGQASPRAFAAIEHVHSSPQMGVSSAFKFGASSGALRMALVAAGIPFEPVSPRKWQQALSCRMAGGKGFGQRDATAAKNLTKAKAQELFPGVKVTHAIADALLLAEYCRRARLERSE